MHKYNRKIIFVITLLIIIMLISTVSLLFFKHTFSFTQDSINLSNTKIAASNSELYKELQVKTQAHIKYLTDIGLKERASAIKVSLFVPETSQIQNKSTQKINFNIFHHQEKIPDEVLNFNATEKNTLITTDPSWVTNNPDDLKKILDVRLYPVLKNLIQQTTTQVFLGSRLEMEAYYYSINSKILFEFKIPSSAVYYLAQDKNGKYFTILAGLVSRENVIAQLITLKLASVKMENVSLIGRFSHFKNLVYQDMLDLEKKMPELKKGKKAVIVAGCDMEGTVVGIIGDKLRGTIGEPKKFRGNIVSLTYIPILSSDNASDNAIDGLIALNLNYGEIMEDEIKFLLEHFNSKYVFTGGAGGFIAKSSLEKKPNIGNRISILKSMDGKGEQVEFAKNESLFKTNAISETHLQTPSIFLETYAWLTAAQKKGSSVDVETFYIMRAIKNYNKKYPDAIVKADCGYFVSDYVGQKPLREYSKVYQNYEPYLLRFLNVVINRAG